MRKQASWRRVFAAALIGSGLALVGFGAVQSSALSAGAGAHATVQADTTWTLVVIRPAGSE
jgi:hypothetical protein